MELAPFQLTDYFVPSIRVEAALDYTPEKPADLDVEALELEHSCVPQGVPKERQFIIEMTIRQKASKGKNLPYTYEIQLVGFVLAHPDFPAEKLQHAVEVNGPTMLFGAAREIIRAATGRGPYGPVLIPSTTFFKRTEGATRKTRKPISQKKRTPAKKSAVKNGGGGGS